MATRTSSSSASKPPTSKARSKPNLLQSVPLSADTDRSVAPAWPIGERPTVRMAYMDFPEYKWSPQHRLQGYGTYLCAEEARERVACGTNEIVEKVEAERASVRQRVATRAVTGWASEKRETYRPLGAMVELPESGAEVRKSARGKYHTPTIVMPDEPVSTGREANQTATVLVAGKRVRGNVGQFEYRYYQIKLDERFSLSINLTCLSGDPDIFVSNTATEPTSEEHTWKVARVRRGCRRATAHAARLTIACTWQAASAGDDEVFISTEHPEFILGTYYIGVYGIYDSEYELEVKAAN